MTCGQCKHLVSLYCMSPSSSVPLACMVMKNDPACKAFEPAPAPVPIQHEPSRFPAVKP